MFPNLPTAFGTYELLELLPGGGMSYVYKARTKIGKVVVVKILKPEENDPETKQRFIDEARTAATLNHTNIVSVYDFGEIDGRLFMVMEYLNGRDLSKCIAENTLDLRQKVRIAADAASALRHVHQHEILHRDIKPANIFICEDGAVKLIDFGIAKSSLNTFKTRAGFTVGTLHYMAPEQVHGESDRRTDVYAFGLVVNQLLTGRPPVEGDTVQTIFYNILNQPLDLQPLESMQVPRELIHLVRDCTQKDATLRPQSFDDVCARLSRVLESLTPISSIAAPPQPVPVSERQKKNPAIWALAIFIPVVAFVAWYFLRPAAAPAPTAPAAAAPPPQRSGEWGEMVLVSGGKFLFGRNNDASELPAFYVDRTEVPNRTYAAYCRKFGCAATDGDPALPATNVTFEAARTFCESVGKRLPSAREWEKAARGTEGNLYPWGNSPLPGFANVESKAAKEVGAHASGQSPYGALDLAGNVWEWVLDKRTPTAEELKVFREMGLTPPVSESEPWALIYGGSYAGPVSHMYDPALVPARYADKTIGFRCVANP